MSDGIQRGKDKAPKPITGLHGTIKSPPFSARARIEAGRLLARLQNGESMGLPHSRPMPSIGPRCHELRIRDSATNWRIIYRLDEDAILVLDVFAKKSEQTRIQIVRNCKSRLSAYDERVKREEQGRPDGTSEA